MDLPEGRRAVGPSVSQVTPAAVAPVFQEIKLPARPEWGGGWAAEIGLPGGDPDARIRSRTTCAKPDDPVTL